MLYFFIFIVSMIPSLTIRDVENSKVVNYMYTNTPFVSKYTSSIKSLCSDINKVVDENKENDDEEENNEAVLDLMLKYDFITVESTDKLIEQKRILVNSSDFIDKYR